MMCELWADLLFQEMFSQWLPWGTSKEFNLCKILLSTITSWAVFWFIFLLLWIVNIYAFFITHISKLSLAKYDRGNRPGQKKLNTTLVTEMAK